MNENDFIQGGIDCRKGVPHQDGMSESYDLGYAAQHELEQVMDSMTEVQDGRFTL